MALASAVLVAHSVAGLALAGAAPEAGEVRLEAEPGTVVRWEAAGTSECEADGQSWKPHGAVCYFPIDLGQTVDLEISRVRRTVRERATIVMGEYPYPVQHVTVEQSYVDLSREDIDRSRREQKRIAALWSKRTERQFEIPLQPPLADAPAARNFGSRRVFNNQPRNPHSGADFSAVPGTPALATAKGTVALAEEHFFGGNSVFIDHGDGLLSMYMHLSEILVAAGDPVEAGAIVGKVGATGRVSGPHLHFGFRWRGARIDPSVLIDE